MPMTGTDGSAAGTGPVDVLVVGAGPVGLYAAYYAGFRGLSTTLVDVLPFVGGQISALYPGKLVHDVAGFPAVSGADLVAGLLAQARTYRPDLRLETRVVDLRPAADDCLEALTEDATGATGPALVARCAVLATGAGDIRPRELPLLRQWRGRGVEYPVSDARSHTGDHVIVVGGGDSALDWAIALHPAAASVTVVHRRDTFRAHAALPRQAAAAGVRLLTASRLVGVDGDDRVRGVTVRGDDGSQQRLPADLVVPAIGLRSSPAPLDRWGVRTVGRKAAVESTMATSLPRVFAAGDATTFPGKVPLIATGLGEAATAVNNAAILLDPTAGRIPPHSTDVDPLDR